MTYGQVPILQPRVPSHTSSAVFGQQRFVRIKHILTGRQIGGETSQGVQDEGPEKQKNQRCVWPLSPLQCTDSTIQYVLNVKVSPQRLVPPTCTTELRPVLQDSILIFDVIWHQTLHIGRLTASLWKTSSASFWPVKINFSWRMGDSANHTVPCMSLGRLTPGVTLSA